MKPNTSLVSAAVKLSHRILPSLTFAALFASYLVPGSIHAQTVEEFKSASEAGGCGLIPYPSPRGDCVDAESKKKEACSKKFSCGQDLDRKEKSIIEDRIRNGEECLARREAVYVIFERARDTLRSENQKEREPYARRSVEKIESGRDTHKKAMEEVKKAIFYCKELAR